MDQDKNLTSFVEKFVSADQSCFDAFKEVNISQCSNDLLRWARMMIQRFRYENDINSSSNPKFPNYNEKSVGILHEIELEIGKRPEPHIRINRRPEDPEWDELFKFQTLFRTAHNVSVAGLLRKLELPTSSTSILYRPTSSSKDRTPTLRQKLKQLRDHPEEFDLTTFEETFKERLYDFNQRNRTVLNGFGISKVRKSYVSCEEEITDLMIDTNDDLDQDVTIAALRKLADDSAPNLIELSMTIGFCRWSFAHYLQSPININTCRGKETGSIIRC